MTPRIRLLQNLLWLALFVGALAVLPRLGFALTLPVIWFALVGSVALTALIHGALRLAAYWQVL